MRITPKSLARLATRATIMQAAKALAEDQTGLEWRDIPPSLRAYFSNEVRRSLSRV